MNAKNHSYKFQYPVKEVSRLKTVDLRVGVTRPDLVATIKEVFMMAKSGGRELDLTFCASSPGSSALRETQSK